MIFSQWVRTAEGIGQRLRQTCRARKDLVRHRVAVGNQLRAHLLIVLPGAAGLFSRPGSAISLAFLYRFGCQDQAG